MPLLGVVFNPDGTRLATASNNGTAEIRDVATAQTLLTITSTSTVRALAFSPDGTRLATATDGGTAQIWDATYVLPIDDLAALARTRVTRAFTLAECQQYLHLTQCTDRVQTTSTP